MLVSSQLSQTATVERCVQIWANRYLPDLSQLPIGDDPAARQALRLAAAPAGRSQTVAKLSKTLVEDRCKLAAVRVKELYEHLPQVCDLMEAVHLSQFASRIYLKLLEVYQVSALEADPLQPPPAASGSSLSAWGMPKIDQLAGTLEPLLLDFQAQHRASQNWRTLGFITTQMNFTNGLLLEQLSPAEQVLIEPYLTFLEEQVALPWQRVCAATANYSLNSPAFILVEYMLPMASDLAQQVYDQLCRAYPNQYSRRGKLEAAAVRHSCLRDITMFQVYLWLSVLEGNANVIEQELIALCIMVMERVDVPWQLTIKGTELMIEAILQRLDPFQKTVVQPYAEAMLTAFRSR
jgi:Phycobilisome protein